MKKFFFILIFLITKQTQSQDVHYSQFEKTKSLLNPSLIAYQTFDYEIQLQRRSQWASVTTPFNTFSLSFSAKEFYKKLSIGGTLLTDVAGDSRFSTDGVSLFLVNTYIIQKHTLSISAQTAVYQRGIKNDHLEFLEAEELNNISFLFFDFGLGISNYIKIDRKKSFLIGISSYHLNKPKQSLTKNKDVFLHPKYVFHAMFHNRINKKISLSPKGYYSSQKQDRELVFGCGLEYVLTQKTTLFSGFYIRKDDAFFINLGLQKENIEVMVSYDINTSSLVPASNYSGAFEFSISYGWFLFKERKKINTKEKEVCPKYI